MSHPIQAADYRDSIGPGDKDTKWVVSGTAYSSSNPYAGEGEESGIAPGIRIQVCLSRGPRNELER